MPAGMRGDEALFLRAPIPMWVFDRETLRFLAVNDEAVERYGYPRDAFLSMTIEDIRPPEDVPRVREEVARPRASRGSTGTWRHVRRDGSTIDVEVTAVDVTYAGRPARLVAVVDVTERERARRERDRTEARSAAIVASSLDAIVLMDHEGRITEFNPAAERIFGHRQEEVLGRPLAETIVPPELRARHREGLARFRRTGRGRVLGRRLELTGMRADGTTFPVELSIVRVDLPGEPLFAGTIRDITDRKRAEEELVAWGAVFELARWGIAEVDPAARTIVRANPAFAAMHGYAPDELIGRPPIELYAPEERHRVRKAVAEATRTGHHVFEAARLRRDGSTFHALVDLTVVRDEGGGEAKRLVSVLDVSDLRRARDRLAFLAETGALLSAGKEPEEVLARAARAAVPAVADWCAVDVVEPDGSLRPVALVHPDPAMVELAEGLRRRFPPAAEGLLGEVLRTGRPALLPEIRPEMLEAAARDEEHARLLRELGLRSAVVVPIATAERVVGVVTLVAAGSGRTYGPEDLAMAEEFARRAAGAIDQHALYAETRALNLELERRVAERTRELEEINAELDAFAYSVSHDLRAPLRAMEGFGRALEEDMADRLDETGRDHVHRIVRAARRMDALIQDLLAYSQLTRSELQLQPVDLDACVAEAREWVQAEIEARGAVVEAGRGMPRVVAHPATLVQVLANLLGNAVKFGEPGVVPRVEIRAEERGTMVRIEVRDNGIGIAPEHQERIFRVLERLHGADAYTGTGIGLAIVRRGVERMGGRVGVTSSPGAGSTFWIELPAGEGG